MVVIVIVAVLSSLAFMMAKRATEKAKSVEMVNRMRQAGTFLFAKASDNAGSIEIFVGGDAHHESRLITYVAEGLGFDSSTSSNNRQKYEAVKGIVYTPATDPGKWNPWETIGPNLDDNDRLGVKWRKTWDTDDNGNRGQIRYLNPGTVRRSSAYPLLADSSNGEGVPRLRFGNDNDHKFAMRYNGKGAALFLDGSARSISQSDMADFGITHAYLFENGPNSKPTLVRSRRR
jgi:hypothetical protein